MFPTQPITLLESLATEPQGPTASFKLPTIVLNGMPKQIYIFACEPKTAKLDAGSNMGVCSTDTFFPIGQIKVTMGSKVVLNPMDDYALYQIT